MIREYTLIPELILQSLQAISTDDKIGFAFTFQPLSQKKKNLTFNEAK